MTESTIKCEYLIENKRCRAIQENEGATSFRLKSCRNEPKDACCYLCDLKKECDVSCSLFDEEKLSERDNMVLEAVPYDRGSARDGLIILGFILMVIGFFVAFAMPYNINSTYTYYDVFTNSYHTATSTITVYGHPFGWVLDGIGFFVLLMGLVTHPNGSRASTTQRTFQGRVCGDCHFFGKEDCPRQEKIFNAMPCEDFTP